MPELPEVEAVRRELLPVMLGARFERVITNRRDLRTAFPADFAERLEGHRVVSLERRGKYLLGHLSSSEVLVMHLGILMSSGATIVFNDPRRFGFMEILARDGLSARRGVGLLGPEPLSDEFDADALARACCGKKTSLKAALSDQRVVAGLGNIYVVEALHRAGLSPRRRASTIATRSGAPRESAAKLAAAIKRVLLDALTEKDDDRFRVYDREGQRCPTRRCTGVVRRTTQAGRSTFFCPVCQR
jgi:formamidopyrimidine-DNA glycosylase